MNWRKLTIVVDTDSQMILSANISIGPSNDGVILREMFEGGLIPSCQVLLADSGYDCRGNEAVFRPIRRGGCYKSPNRINLFLRWLFCRIIGLYGKRWKAETVFSVIKRRFSDRIKSDYSKFIESYLIPTAYNIWRSFIPSHLTLLT